MLGIHLLLLVMLLLLLTSHLGKNSLHNSRNDHLYCLIDKTLYVRTWL